MLNLLKVSAQHVEIYTAPRQRRRETPTVNKLLTEPKKKINNSLQNNCEPTVPALQKWIDRARDFSPEDH
jgi:hypothetical protein